MWFQCTWTPSVHFCPPKLSASKISWAIQVLQKMRSFLSNIVHQYSQCDDECTAMPLYRLYWVCAWLKTSTAVQLLDQNDSKPLYSIKWNINGSGCNLIWSCSLHWFCVCLHWLWTCISMLSIYPIIKSRLQSGMVPISHFRKQLQFVNLEWTNDHKLAGFLMCKSQGMFGYLTNSYLENEYEITTHPFLCGFKVAFFIMLNTRRRLPHRSPVFAMYTPCRFTYLINRSNLHCTPYGGIQVFSVRKIITFFNKDFKVVAVLKQKF